MPGYRLGQVCAKTGLTPKQLRDWERHGLVRPGRGVGNQRAYDEDALRRLMRAVRLRGAGLGLADITLALAILDGTDASQPTRAVGQVRRVLARIRSQLDLADELSEAIRVRLQRMRDRGVS